jgi:TolB-like protein/tetratricopeptide (TPR) repeat protein
MPENLMEPGASSQAWKTDAAPPSEQEIRAELERVLASSIFSQSDRLARFLRFTVEHALAGKGDSLKEYVIGVSVYDRKPPYHPSQDSIVRTEARRLRTKLKEYYEAEGSNSSVFIYYRLGNYAPTFRRASPQLEVSEEPPLPASSNLLASGSGVRLAVLPFVDISHHPLSTQCAQGLTDDLIHAFNHTEGVKIASPAAVEHAMSQPWDLRGLMSTVGVTCAIEGSVRIDDEFLRVTIRVVNEDGFQAGSHRFETFADPTVIAEVQEQIVSAFISRARPLQTRIRKHQADVGALAWAIYPLVIQAETMLNEGSAADIQPAMLRFQESLEIAPFARSYCGIAQCHLDLALRGATPSSEVVGRAIAAAEKAIQLDAEMFGCYSTLATAHALAWNWEAAEKQFAKSLALGVHGPSSRQYALYLAVRGRFEEGAEHLAIANRIDPFSYRQKVASAKFLHLAGRFEELLSSPTTRGRYGAVPLESKIMKGLSLAHLGLNRQAQALVDEIQAENQPHSLLFTALAEILALSGDLERATKIATTYGLFGPATRVSSCRLALLALALGDEAGCCDLLEKGIAEHEAEMIWLQVDPRFHPIRTSSTFQQLVERVSPAHDFAARSN